MALKLVRLTRRLVNSHHQLGSSLSFVLAPQCTRLYSRLRERSRREANYYDILGLTPNASQTDIKAAYYKLSKLYHPDMNKSMDAERKFAEISEAYEVLGNHLKRREYDQGFFSHQPGAGHGYSVPDVNFEKFKRQKFVSKKGTFKMGVTDIYDFDEFYRQHYSDNIGRMKGAQEAKVRQDKADKLEAQRSIANFAWVIAFIGVIGAVIAKSNHDKLHEK